MKLRIVILVLIQLAGAAVCAAMIAPWMTPPSAVARGPQSGPRLHTPVVDETSLTTRIEAIPEGFDARAAQRLDTVVALRGPIAEIPYPWHDVGARILSRHDRKGQRALVERGFQLRSGVLEGEGEPWKAVFALRSERARTVLEALARMIDRPPHDARWDFGMQRVTPHRVGYRVDIERSLRAMHDALVQGHDSVELVVETIQPRVVLNEELEALELNVELARYKTKYERRKRDRVTNLTLAATPINGMILMPGDSFSYNDVVGERSEARGFKEAPVIVQGEIVEGLGGGACQISSTLHAASLFGGLDIVERHNHTLESKYITKGLDAVVSWPNIDLRLRNPYNFPVVLHVHLVNERVIASVWSPEPGRKVRLRREITDELPYRARVEVVEDLEEGESVIVRHGTYGYRVRRGRIIWEGDKESFERLPQDTYQPRPRLVKTGPNTVYPPEDDEENPDSTPPEQLETKPTPGNTP